MSNHGRIYKTADGRHVSEGDPDAATLAYSEFDNPPKGVLDELEGKKDKPKAEAEKAPGLHVEKKAPLANKQTKPADK